MQELRGRVAVVTGAASGIGLAMARRFGEEGMKVVLSDVEEQALADATKTLESEGHRVLGVRLRERRGQREHDESCVLLVSIDEGHGNTQALDLSSRESPTSLRVAIPDRRFVEEARGPLFGPKCALRRPKSPRFHCSG